MPAVKRQKALTAPPSLCCDCYWQSLVRLLRDENRQLRHDLIKARAEKRVIVKSEKIEHQDEPIRPGQSLQLDDQADKDLVDLFNRSHL